MDETTLRRDTLRAWFVVVVALILWIAAIVTFGYPAVIIGALCLTVGMYAVMLLIMRG